MAKYQIQGMRELEFTIKRLGDLPQKCVTKAAKKGMNISLKSSRSKAPYEFGNLRKGIVLKGEKSRVKGKKVYQVTFDKSMNDIFVKISKKGDRSYYPASQEYGFTTNGKYVPGYHYMKKSLEGNKSKIENEIVNVLSKEFDKLK